MHEAAMHEDNSFITLTYDDDHPRTSLDYAEVQSMYKRMRHRVGGFRHFTAGEYGELYGRPHYHAILFGVRFSDLVVLRNPSEGFKLWTSQTLSDLWPYGFSSVGEVSFESACYVARYCTKKVTGEGAERHYERFDVCTGEITSVKPEFAHMSLKPGIGATWLEKYAADVYPRDYVTVNGRKVKPPKFYDRKVAEKFAFDYDAMEFERMQKAQRYAPDCTPERLAEREHVAKAQLRLKERKLE